MPEEKKESEKKPIKEIKKKTELELQKIFPKKKWGEAHHWLIWHGRLVCKARKPECENCVVKKFCQSCEEYRKGYWE